MQSFQAPNAPDSISPDSDWSTVTFLGSIRCPHCNRKIKRVRLMLGEVSASCRRCCYWRIEHRSGIVEEGHKPSGIGFAPDRGYHVYRRPRQTATLTAA